MTISLSLMCSTDWWTVGGAAASAAESPPHCSPGRTLEWIACRTEQRNTRYPPEAKSRERLKGKKKEKEVRTDTWRGRRTAGNVFRPPDSSSPCWRWRHTLWPDHPATPGVSEQPGSPSAPPAAHLMGSELRQRVKNQLKKSFPVFILGFSPGLWKAST